MSKPEPASDHWQDHVAASAPCSPADMNARVARFGEVPASPRAFVDTWVPGHERTLYSVIGTGVTDNPDFRPKISAAENFHVDFIVAPRGCGAALHWHTTEEVFIVQAGRWEVDWIDGATGKTHTVTLGPRDTISVPPRVHRAFRSLDGDDLANGGGMLISVLGGKVPDRVKWDESLRRRAQALGAGFDAAGNAVKRD
ncbi:MAG: cupin domain-containing protein [Burkholderiales bacterium]|nr:cupin domain-containing protein [Burkholderiales bacterium]